MTMRDLEKVILQEARTVTGNPKLRDKDIMEWRSGRDSIKSEPGEKLFYLPGIGVTIAVRGV